MLDPEGISLDDEKQSLFDNRVIRIDNFSNIDTITMRLHYHQESALQKINKIYFL